jgi:5'-nucleotidase / UDP-sugar diphosphatase
MPISNQISNRLTGIVLAGVLTVAMTAAAVAESAKISFLHINDVYEFAAKRGVGGMAELQTLLKAERAKGHVTVTTLGGDLISPSVMSGLTKGTQMISMMNAIGVDLAGLGNHEFDFGDDVLKMRLAESKFKWLATNTLGADGHSTRLFS